MEAVSTKAASIKILDCSLMKNFHERRSGMAYPVNPVTFQATSLELHIYIFRFKTREDLLFAWLDISLIEIHC